MYVDSGRKFLDKGEMDLGERMKIEQIKRKDKDETNISIPQLNLMFDSDYIPEMFSGSIRRFTV